MSELYKQPKSPFWFYTITVDGKRVRRSTKQRDKNKAKTVLREAEQKAHSSGVESLSRKACTLEQFMGTPGQLKELMESEQDCTPSDPAEGLSTFLDWVRDSQKIKDSTKRFYRCGVKLLKASKLAGIRLGAITQDDCETTAFPGGPYNANKALRTLRKILTVAQGRKLIFGTLPKIQMRKVVGRSLAMSRSDAELIASKMPDGDAKDCFLVLRGTGMRPSEAMAMDWKFLRLDAGLYQNPDGKTKSAKRPVPLLNGSLAILQRRHKEQGCPVQGWVFPKKRSGTGHIATITKAFNRARDAAKLPKALVVYTARHGALTDLASVLTIAETMMIGGHTDVRTAMSYQHPHTLNLQAKLDALQTEQLPVFDGLGHTLAIPGNC
jgi:integrase